jgi:hypothetical protein
MRNSSEKNGKFHSSEICKAKTNFFGVPKLSPLCSTLTVMTRITQGWPHLQDLVIFRQLQPLIQPSMERFSEKTADLDHAGPPFWVRNG